jgi:protein ImuB
MKRIVCVWLPLLAIDRLCRGSSPDSLLATAAAGGQRRIAAVSRAARAAGVRPGATVADARAVAPGLKIVAADPPADRALLDHLADWVTCYTPWAAPDDWTEGGEGGGLWLDITGCAHLFGGEDKLLAELVGRLARLGFTARAAAADTPGAAWAWARFGAADQPVLPPGRQRDLLAGLPVTGLRLLPATVVGLTRLGLRSIGQLMALPPAGLTARFGPLVSRRLEQALGGVDEPISPRRPPLPHQVHRAFAEPIARPEDVTAATRHLLERLTVGLEPRRLGVCRLVMAAFRVDSSVQRMAIGTSRPSRDPLHLLCLLSEPLASLDAGFGIEMLRASALEVAPLDAVQAPLGFVAPDQASDDVTRLLDTLGNRLGFDRVIRFASRQSHLPERAVQRLPASPLPLRERACPGLDPGEAPSLKRWEGEGFSIGRRPLRLFVRPEAIEAMAPVPDSPPLLFRWRRTTHRIRRADGPERLAAEWWRESTADRDYYCVEDDAGCRFWLFRQGRYGADPPPRWFVHGIFA